MKQKRAKYYGYYITRVTQSSDCTSNEEIFSHIMTANCVNQRELTGQTTAADSRGNGVLNYFNRTLLDRCRSLLEDKRVYPRKSGTMK